MSEQKYVYVVLSSTGTIVSRTVRFLFRDRYTHASISIEPDLSVMYSFSREYIYFPFYGRFRAEKTDQGFLAKRTSIPARVIALPVSDAQYEMVKHRIEHFTQNRLRYGYNYIGLFLNIIGIAYAPQKRYTCSQFVSETLAKCNIASFDRDFSLIRPIMLANLKGDVVFEGNLKEFRRRYTAITPA